MTEGGTASAAPGAARAREEPRSSQPKSARVMSRLDARGQRRGMRPRLVLTQCWCPGGLDAG